MPWLPPESSWPQWMAVARDETKLRKISRGINPRLIDYFGATHGQPLREDDQPWASAFCCWAMREAGYPTPESRLSRDWLPWGMPLVRPRFGCITIFGRGASDSGKGYVGFYAGPHSSHACWILGAEPRGSVDFWKPNLNRLIGFRWPIESSVDDDEPTNPRYSRTHE